MSLLKRRSPLPLGMTPRPPTRSPQQCRSDGAVRQWQRRRAVAEAGGGTGRAASRWQGLRGGGPVRPLGQSSLPSWIIGSSSLVFRSTARTIVRSSTPSGLAATAGMICRESGRLKRTVKVPSGRSWTGSPCRVTRALGSVAP